MSEKSRNGNACLYPFWLSLGVLSYTLGNLQKNGTLHIFAWLLAISLQGLNAQIFVGNDGAVEEFSLSGAPIKTLASGLGGPGGLTVTNGDVYYSENEVNRIGEYSTSTSQLNPSLVSGISNPSGLAVSADNLYIASLGSGTVGEYNATSGAVQNASLIGVNSNYIYPTQLEVSGDLLYVSYTNNSTSEISTFTTSGGVVDPALLAELPDVSSFSISGNLLFVAGFDGTVGVYTTGGTPINTQLITGISNLDAIATDGNEILVTTFVTMDGNSRGEVDEYTYSNGQIGPGTTLISNLVDPSYLAIATPEPRKLSVILAFALGLLIFARKRRVKS